MAIVAVLAAGCAGCGADTATPGDPPPPTSGGSTPVATDPPATAAPTTSTTAAVSSDEAEVRATIDRYWEAYLGATNPPDPENPRLNSILTGDAKLRITGAIQVMKQEGRAVIKPTGSRFESRVLSVEFRSDGVALVNECVIDDLKMVRVETGEVLDDDLVTTRYETTLNQFDGSWLITTSELAEKTEGVSGCASGW